MDRFIAKDAKLDKYDFTKLNLRNSYLSGCSLVGSILGDCTNASFFKCDLTDSDWSKAEFKDVGFKDCIGLSTIKLLPAIQGFIHQITAPIKAGLIDALSHQFMATACENYALTLKDKKYQDIFNEMAVDLRTHPEMCWPDFIKLWGLIKWPHDEEYARLGVEMVKSDPNMYKQWVRFAVPILKDTYTNLV